MTKKLAVALVVGAFTCHEAMAFDAGDLKGLWAESTYSRYACTSTNRHQRMELAPDGRSLRVTLIHSSSKMKPETVILDIQRRDEHSLYFTLPRTGEAGLQASDEWAITMLGPGVYRWHMTSEHENLKPAPIGVRCEP